MFRIALALTMTAAALAQAQSINVAIGPTNIIPSSSYAAAGRPGAG